MKRLLLMGIVAYGLNAYTEAQNNPIEKITNAAESLDEREITDVSRQVYSLDSVSTSGIGVLKVATL